MCPVRRVSFTLSVAGVASVRSADIMESEMIPACKLMEIVLQNCRGRVDSQIGPYMELALGRLRIAEKGTLKDFCVEVSPASGPDTRVA